MTTVDSSYSKTLAFQPPTNLNAIRSTLLKRIHQKKQKTAFTSQASLPASPMSMSSSSSPPLPPTTTTTKVPSLLDHGLPSPPVEYQKKQQVDTMDIDGHHDEVDDEEEDDAVSTISSLPPTNNASSVSSAVLDAPSLPLSPTTATTTTTHSSSSSSSSSLSADSWNAQQLELKIKQLKEEKHQLFTQMKNLLQQEEKQTISRPSPLKTTCSLLGQQRQGEENLTQQEQQSSLPSPSPSPTSTPKTMNLQAAKQKSFLKPTSLPSSRSSLHNNHAFPYLQQQQQQQQYRRRRSSLTSNNNNNNNNNCLSAAAAAAAAMMTSSRYHPHSATLSFGTASTNPNMLSPTSSSMTMDNNGRYRYSPYGGYFSPISSPPSGYNVRRPSYLSSRSTSSLASTTSSSSSLSTIPVSSSSSSSSNTFRPSRSSLVYRHSPRY